MISVLTSSSLLYDFVGRHLPRAIAGTKRRQSPSRISFILIPTLPAYAAIWLAMMLGSQLGVVVSCCAGAAMQIGIIGAWMHSAELDHEDGLALLQSVPRPALLRTVYRSTPSMLALHWTGICAVLLASLTVHSKLLPSSAYAATVLVAEGGAASMIINEVRILIFGSVNTRTGWHLTADSTAVLAEHYGPEGIRAVHPPCMVAMLCFYACTIVLSAGEATGTLSAIGNILTLLPIVHGGAAIWSLSSNARTRSPVRIWRAPSESMLKWAVGWRGTAVLNVFAMMLSCGLSVANLILVLVAIEHDAEVQPSTYGYCRIVLV
jgi:hypothetical protein